ncbi:response regulator transcription factor [Moritella sp. F3]|uniref:response regulator transcription factor n=1 Tax=Moritella sp. F3 TaxID=2718882 RepID=UPI0018E136C9|nr:response regulator transcription factor [Moritella sp. F3]GIC79216.1 DNA-binding response regulator [Moritella sp. F1]GIC81096.1 DNA-binding response regulator [Moritella sp. F3]
MLNLLLVEDDLDLATAVVDYLELEDIQCDHAANGLAGLNMLMSNDYQAVILDLNLPKMDGLTVCKNMREQGIDTPVLMLTARDSLDDKLVGFDSGADDYLVKPFAMEELIVRMQVLARRRSGQVKRLTLADLELDLQQKQAYRAKQLLKLSPTAWKILETLMRASPNPVSREKLMQSVWGDEQPDSNSLKVHIFNLRKQLGAGDAAPLLQTISGIGFALRTSTE